MFTKFSRYILPTCILCSICFFSACDNGNVSSGDEGHITGVSQKGPFIAGSTVNLFGLDSNLHQTGNHLATTIDNSRGEFSFDEMEVSSRFAWMQAKGYYLNEITGDTSAMEISLNGLVDLSKGKKANINILSHMAFNRIKNLVGNGMSVEKAKEQAEKEVLSAFGLESDGSSFEELDIMSNSEDDAKLLALSIMMLMYDADSLTEKMSIISNDMESDGVLNDTTLFPNLESKLIVKMYSGLVDNVKKVLKSAGAKKIPPFEKYLYKMMPDYPFFDSCPIENEVKTYTDPTPSNPWHCSACQYHLYDGAYICRNSKWKRYYGLRGEGDDPVDTVGRYGVMTDARDRNSYKTVTLDLESGKSAVWFVDFSRYGLDTAETTEFTIAKAYEGACPTGWHMPSLEEFLAAFEGSSDRAVRNRELLLMPTYLEDETSYGFKDYGMDHSFLVLNYADDGTLNEKSPYLANVFHLSYQIVGGGSGDYYGETVDDESGDDYEETVDDGYSGEVRCVKDSL